MKTATSKNPSRARTTATRASTASEDAARDALLKSDGFKKLDPKVQKIAETLAPSVLAQLIKKAEKEAAKLPSERVQDAPEGSSLAKMAAAAGVRAARGKGIAVSKHGVLTVPTRTPSQVRAARAKGAK